jgi:23S rRNA (uracil1939-C5)-methyltransferase
MTDQASRASKRPFRPQRPGSRPPVKSGNQQRRRPAQTEGPEQFIDNLRIERIVGAGAGIGFDEDGLAVFVPRTAPGDVIRARVTRRQGKVYHAEIAEIVEPSSLRIEPRVADDASGGLDFQHLGYEDQVRIKGELIAESLRRLAKLDPVPDIQMVPSPNAWHYRSRAEFQIDHATGAVGYFATNSHRVVDVEESPVLTLETQALLTTLRDDLAAGLVPKENREYRAVTGDLGSVLEPTTAPRSRTVTRDVGGETFQYSAECFFQANIPVTELLLAEVLRIGGEAQSAEGLALDLYCGVGLFTVPLARQFRRVIGVESFKPAAGFAETNLANAGLKQARIVNAPVEHWLAGDRSPLGRVALAVFDPPRSGAGKATIDNLAKLKPAHVAAVSCDPATFARDVRDLVGHGYEVVSVKGFDMFPQTHHVEIVTHLRRVV